MDKRGDAYASPFSFEGVFMSVKDFYHSGAWADTRAAYRRSVGGLCERCLSKGIITAGYDVHHKVHLTTENVGDPAISLSWDNLELLCRDCHAEEHSRERKGMRYTVDELGRVTPMSS